MKKVALSFALTAGMAAVGCRTGSSGSSDVKDFGNNNPSVPETVTAEVPTGTSSTGLLSFSFPIQAKGLEVHTNCNLQLTSVIVASEVGVGPLVNGGNNTWMTQSGLSRTFTGIQLTTNNFGPPSFCNYTVSAAGGGGGGITPLPAPPQTVTTEVPTGTSTTGLLSFSQAIHAKGLEVHTTCNLQLVSVLVASEVGVGPLVNGGNDTWMTQSGLARNFTGIQLTTNNFGPPAFCSYTVSQAGSGAVPQAEASDNSGN